jgi:hypothetical protein
VDTCSFIALDGFVVPGRFLNGSGVAWRQGVRSGADTERPFVFSKVDESSNCLTVLPLTKCSWRPPVNSEKVTARDTGTIALRIKRIVRGAGRPANTIQKIPPLSVGNRRLGDICIGCVENLTSVHYMADW